MYTSVLLLMISQYRLLTATRRANEALCNEKLKFLGCRECSAGADLYDWVFFREKNIVPWFIS